MRSVTLACTLAATLALAAQTYTPKTIRLEGPSAADTANLLRIAALPPNAPLTKEQIEAALQRLADTGLFTDISYTVNADALTIKLAAPSTAQSLPVRYVNFAWWQPDELERLVEARVSLFHGQLPLSGNLTDQVISALTALLREKGIDAEVSAMQSTIGTRSIALVINRPEIVLGETHLEGASSAFLKPLDAMRHKLAGADFDLEETATSIRENIGDIYDNAGYLDIATSAPAFSAPHKDLNSYAVDATDTIHEGELYRVGHIDLPPLPPLSESDLTHAADLKSGAPASVLALRIAKGEVAKAYSDLGYLDASAEVSTSKDASAHTVAYAFNIHPGEIYRVASLDTSVLTPEQHASFDGKVHFVPGTIADHNLMEEIMRALVEIHSPTKLGLAINLDRVHHTAGLVIRSAPAR